jgi:hypothetical protein
MRNGSAKIGAMTDILREHEHQAKGSRQQAATRIPTLWIEARGSGPMGWVRSATPQVGIRIGVAVRVRKKNLRKEMAKQRNSEVQCVRRRAEDS